MVLKSIKALELPLPPLVEQQRIAAQLRSQLADIERASIAADEQQKTVRKLPAALVRRAFADGCAEGE